MINLIIQSILELILTSIPVEQDIIRYIRANFARTTRKYLINACQMFFASWFEFLNSSSITVTNGICSGAQMTS